MEGIVVGHCRLWARHIVAANYAPSLSGQVWRPSGVARHHAMYSTGSVELPPNCR